MERRVQWNPSQLSDDLSCSSLGWSSQSALFGGFMDFPIVVIFHRYSMKSMASIGDPLWKLPATSRGRRCSATHGAGLEELARSVPWVIIRTRPARPAVGICRGNNHRWFVRWHTRRSNIYIYIHTRGIYIYHNMYIHIDMMFVNRYSWSKCCSLIINPVGNLNWYHDMTCLFSAFRLLPSVSLLLPIWTVMILVGDISAKVRPGDEEEFRPAGDVATSGPGA